MRVPVISRFEYHVRESARQAGGLLRSRYGLWFLGMVSFVESVLPIPLITDPFLIAYLLANRGRAVVAVAVTLVTSVLGGLLSYVAAAYFIELLFAFLTTGMEAEFYEVVDRFRDDTFTLAVIGAITPIPYTIVAMAAGAIQGNLPLFLLGSLVGRGFRYILLTVLAERFGERALTLAERHLTLATVGMLVLAVAYLLYKLL